jgi:DHA2 family multidrug resistance protein-like MFS transporter
VIGDGLPAPARRFAVAVIALGTTMAVLDGTIANIALPTISRELRVEPAATVWVVNAFQIAVAVTLLSFAALGDVVGYRRIYASGIVVFTVGSLLCALSGSLPALVSARILQGLGASAIMSVGPALYRTIFPSDQLGRAVGISALVVASSASAGPTIGGAILAVLPWPWLFAINVPLGAIDAALARRALPPPHTSGARFDIGSSLLSIPAIGLFVVGLDGFARDVPPLLIAGSLAVSIACGAGFIARQARSDAPMLPLDIFAVRRFSLAAVTSLCSFVAQGLAYVSLPFLLQSVLGYSPFLSGLLITPWPLAIAVVSIVAGRLADRYPPPLLCTAGLVVLTAGLAGFATLPPHATAFDVVWRSALCGIGFGFFQSPNNRELLGSVPRRRSGAASGVLATVRVTGQTLGAALVAITFGASAASVVPAAHAAGLAHAAAVSLWLAALAAASAAIASSFRLGDG